MPETTRLSSSEVTIPASVTSVYEAIYTRRNANDYTFDPVPEEKLNRLFDAAVWAPNHRMTEPTRFFALRKDGPARKRIADCAADFAYNRVANPNPAQKRRSAEGARARLMDAPAVVFVYSVPGPTEEVTRENYATACCAVQNMLLAAVAEGLHIGWSTGGVTQMPELAGELGAEEDWEMVGALFIGPAGNAPESRRHPASEVVSWL